MAIQAKQQLDVDEITVLADLNIIFGHKILPLFLILEQSRYLLYRSMTIICAGINLTSVRIRASPIEASSEPQRLHFLFRKVILMSDRVFLFSKQDTIFLSISTHLRY